MRTLRVLALAPGAAAREPVALPLPTAASPRRPSVAEFPNAWPVRRWRPADGQRIQVDAAAPRTPRGRRPPR